MQYRCCGDNYNRNDRTWPEGARGAWKQSVVSKKFGPKRDCFPSSDARDRPADRLRHFLHFLYKLVSAVVTDTFSCEGVEVNFLKINE